MMMTIWVMSTLEPNLLVVVWAPRMPGGSSRQRCARDMACQSWYYLEMPFVLQHAIHPRHRCIVGFSQRTHLRVSIRLS